MVSGNNLWVTVLTRSSSSVKRRIGGTVPVRKPSWHRVKRIPCSRAKRERDVVVQTILVDPTGGPLAQAEIPCANYWDMWRGKKGRHYDCHNQWGLYDIVVEINKYNVLRKLYKMTAWIARFCHISRRNKSDRREGPLTLEEVVESEELWIRAAQWELRNGDNYQQLASKFGLQEDQKGIISLRDALSTLKCCRKRRNRSSCPKNTDVWWASNRSDGGRGDLEFKTLNV